MWHLVPDSPLPNQRCVVCGTTSRHVAAHLGLCADCIRTRWEQAEPLVRVAHAVSRREFDLPSAPPRARNGVTCPLCGQACQISADPAPAIMLAKVARGLVRFQ